MSNTAIIAVTETQYELNHQWKEWDEIEQWEEQERYWTDMHLERLERLEEEKDILIEQYEMMAK